MVLSAGTVIYLYMLSALSTRHEPTASMSSLLLYADGDRLFKAKPPQASLTGFVQGRIQFDPRECGRRIVGTEVLLTNPDKFGNWMPEVIWARYINQSEG
jgi:hypothetical protein